MGARKPCQASSLYSKIIKMKCRLKYFLHFINLRSYKRVSRTTPLQFKFACILRALHDIPDRIDNELTELNHT